MRGTWRLTGGVVATKNVRVGEESSARDDVLERLSESGRMMDALVHIASYDAQSLFVARERDFERMMGTTHEGTLEILDTLAKRGLVEYSYDEASVMKWGAPHVYRFHLTEKGRDVATVEMIGRINTILADGMESMAMGSPTLRQAWKLLSDISAMKNDFGALRR